MEEQVSDCGRAARIHCHKLLSCPAITYNYPQGDSNNPHKTREKRESGNVTARQAARFPPDLERVLDAWPTLPDALRAGILAMIDATQG
jgi:hypothetical protein